MPRCIASCIALLVASAPASCSVASEIHPCWPGVEVEDQVLEGLLRVHLRCEKVLLEIPTRMLGREMLLHTEFAAVSATGDSIAPDKLAASRVVGWVQRGSSVYRENPRFEIAVQSRSGLGRRGKETSLPDLIRRFDVLSRGADGAPIIDVTPMFVHDAPIGFELEFVEHLHRGGIDEARSYVERVKVLPDNIRIRFLQSWTAKPDAAAKPAAASESWSGGALRFVFDANLLLLPEQPMRARYYDPRVGYFAEYVQDFGTDRHGNVQRGLIERYRLEKQDPAAAVSEPVKPLVFYIGREVPQRWKRYLKEAVEMWQAPLEQAGFRNAIRARDARSVEQDP